MLSISVNNKNSSNKIMAQKFRSDLINIYKSCVLTKLHFSNCEAAHIVSKAWCNKNNKAIKFTPFNGLLMNNILHKSFDKLEWTFNMYSVKTLDKFRFKTHTIIAPNLINNAYANQINLQQVILPTLSRLFIKHHYLRFINKHYNNIFEQNQKNLENNLIDIYGFHEDNYIAKDLETIVMDESDI